VLKVSKNTPQSFKAKKKNTYISQKKNGEKYLIIPEVIMSRNQDKKKYSNEKMGESRKRVSVAHRRTEDV
jgi:hypothetical protein